MSNLSTNPNFKLTEAERNQLLVAWNSTQADYPHVCVHELFEAQVQRTPDAIALVAGTQQLTYRALNQRANQLAHYLHSLGVKAESLVGVCIEREPEMMVAILGILKAGGAYLPLDPAYPKERLLYMVSNAEVEVLLTSDALLSTLPDMTDITHLLCLDRDWEVISQESDENSPYEIQPSHLAYVIYTSGSTGKPKGCAMEHLSLTNLLWWHTQTRPASCGLKTLQFCAISFDFSFHEIFSTLCSGGTLVLVADEMRRNPFALAKFIYDNEIEKLFFPVTALQQLAEAIDDKTVPTSLIEVITTGEQLQITPAIISLFRNTGALLHNHYGATEFQDATTFTLSGEPNDWPALSPIGRPLSNVQIYILDELGQPVPIGEVGELYIGGVGVARGYLKHPELTKEKFIPNPFAAAGRLYKTGDLARYQADGTLENLGRADDQVKIRGIRIELGEIEAVLVKHPDIRESVVMAHDIKSHKRLVAYVVARQEIPSGQIETHLHSYLSERLPDYMLPEAFVLLDDMPLTPSGKINRRALPVPKTFRRALESPVLMPQSETEQLLAEILRDVLQLEAIGIHENFFDIGATSLLLIQVHKKLVETFDRQLPTLTLFQYPTIEALSQYLSQQQRKGKQKQKSQKHQSSGQSDIAIIGMSGRFPGAQDIDTFWHNLREGVESISFFSDEEIEQNDPTLLNHPSYVKAGAVLPNIEWFDASFFGFSPKEAAMMDPQQRIFLECAWETFENAGYNPETYAGTVGVYAGSSISTYLVNNVSPNLGYSANQPLIEADMLQFQMKLGNDRNYLPTRVSYKLNLKGPSVNVQSACSTSLVAVHLASQSLLNGECDMALAGGMSIIVPHKGGYLYEDSMIRSPDGHCRAFDAQAAGTLFGNGGGIVLLKRLDDALADGDPIIAVIKGSAINNDGAQKVGFTAPSIERQMDVISDALAVADVDASTVAYVEAHGTGTQLGDPIEIAALTQAFHKSSQEELPHQYCAVGSVKTNIGHLDEAAGIAGLIKAVLALQHKQIPPSLHFKQPNSQIDFENSPFYVNTALSEWTAHGTPRRASVSSFGMGGTNCHIVLEEPLNKEQESGKGLERPIHLLTLSAKTKSALEELVERYVDYLASEAAPVALANICFTANTGRQHFAHRLAIVAESIEQLDMLRHKASGCEVKGGASKIVFLFTGQGSQYVNMGRELYESQPTFRKTIERCDEILRPYLSRSLLSVLYPEKGEASLINETKYTQPALFALEYALAELWKLWGIQPDIVMGHSVGEYVAACVAGVFTLSDGLKLIAERGRLMQALPDTSHGQMVSVMTSEEHIAALILPYKGKVAIAAINGPQSVVISGHTEAINAICTTLEAEGVKSNKLNVSHAFHSPLMEPMLVEFEQVAQQVTYSEPKIKLISNVTGDLASHELTTPDYWVRHVLQPVRFAAGMESLERQGANRFIEIGPKPVLLGMGRQCLPEDDALLWLPSLRPKQNDWQQLLSSLRELYLAGVTVDWMGFDKGYARRRVRLPTYPWQRKRHWIEATDGTKNRGCQNRGHPLIGQPLHLALSDEIIFQSQVSKEFPSWLSDHRVFQSIVMPGVAYLEMALAAGVSIFNSESLKLSDFIIQQAMDWPDENEERTIQVVLQPEEAEAYSFQIFSRASVAPKAKSSWTLHASGKLLIATGHDNSQMMNLAALQTKFTHEISVDLIYQGEREREINLGPSFWATERLWREGTSCLSKISLPKELLSEKEAYQLHPVLLEACFLALNVTYSDKYEHKTYVPFGVEHLQWKDISGTEMWCHAELRAAESEEPQLLKADIRLFAPSGSIILVMEGVLLKIANRQAMLNNKEASRDNWLYQVAWLPHARFGLLPDYLPTPEKIKELLETRLAKLIIETNLAAYGAAFTQLEKLSLAYVVAAFQQMGWKFELGERFSTAQKASSLEVVNPHRQLLERLLEMLAEAEILLCFDATPSMRRWELISIPEIVDPQLLLNDLSEAEAEMSLVSRCGAKLAQVLQGECDPIQLLFPAGDTTALSKVYQEAPVLGVTNTLVQEAVLSALEHLPSERGWRILEIGAGTGGTTSYLLPHLPIEQTEYVFTDISAFFIAKAEERFKDYPFVRYQVLDIEQEPQAQGFALSQYDLIVAADVLHATSDLRHTLKHVRQLLAPGGMLIMMEDSEPARWADLTFGLTEGWWKFTDRELRPSHPLLSPDKWQTLLQEMGFTQTSALWPEIDGPHKLPREAVIVAQANKENQAIITQGKWLLLADENIGQQLAKQLHGQGQDCTLVLAGQKYSEIDEQTFTINPANLRDFEQVLAMLPNLDGVISCWSLGAHERDLEAAMLLSCGSTLHLVQALAQGYATRTLPRLWLVTQGAQAVNEQAAEHVAQSPLWGMGKVIALEHPDMQAVRVDLDPTITGDYSYLVDDILSLSAADNELLEEEVAYRNGVRYVARLQHHQQRRSDAPENQPFRLSIAERGTLDQLQLQPITRYAPGVEEVEIMVHAAGLNFIDVLNAMGLYPSTPPLGIECVGEIVAVGEGVTSFESGERVLAVVQGSFSQYVTVNVNHVAPMPTTLTFEEAATIPEVFLTSYWCLHHTANIAPGDRVLIHAATGGIGQAAIQWAQAAGAEVFCTASKGKWPVLEALGVKYIMNSRTLDFADEVMGYTNGEGVDIVLNSLTGEGFIEKSLSVLSNRGRFVELAKRDIWTSEQVVHFRPDVAYFIVDMEQEWKQQQYLIQRILRKIVQKVDTGVLKPLSKTVFPIQDAVSAFRTMQQAKHTGKIVLSFAEPEQKEEGLRLHSDGHYLVTGGLGGLGLLVASFLVERGAKKLVLVGRSEPKPAARDVISELEQAGAEVKVLQADVSDKAQLVQALGKLGSFKLCGVIHAAGVLDDGVLLQQTLERFAGVMSPKALGAWNLHTLTKNQPLDFFVLFSSATSLLGNSGQANHAAANAFLDALASYRRTLGLPSISINWGTWSEVGIAARLGLDKLSRKQGERTIAPQQGLQILEQLLTDEAHQVGVIPIDWPDFLEKQLVPRPFFSNFTKSYEPSSKSAVIMPTHTSSNGHPDLRRQLENAQPKEYMALLHAHISEQVAQVLGLESSAMLENQDISFFTLGMDSLTSIELRNRLQISLGCSLPSTLVFDYPTLEALEEYLKVLLAKSSQPPTQAVVHASDSMIEHSTLVPIQPRGSKAPLFFVPGILGTVFELSQLAYYLGPEQPFYGLRALGLDENIIPYTSITDIASHHIKALQTIQPHSPYILGGHSFGGKVAFEMAQQLQDQGHEVSLLAIIDSYLPVLASDNDAVNWDNAMLISKLATLYESILEQKLSLEQLHSFSSDKQLSYFIEQLGIAGYKFNQIEVKRMLQVFKANVLSNAEYVPQERHPTSISLFRASELSRVDFLPNEAFSIKDPTWGWGELSAIPIELHIVPGNHFTMMLDPHVHVLAEQLRACLEN